MQCLAKEPGRGIVLYLHLSLKPKQKLIAYYWLLGVCPVIGTVRTQSTKQLCPRLFMI